MLLNRRVFTIYFNSTDHCKTPSTVAQPSPCVLCLQLPLVACLALLSAFPDWVLQKVDSGTEWMLSMMLGEWIMIH